MQKEQQASCISEDSGDQNVVNDKYTKGKSCLYVDLTELRCKNLDQLLKLAKTLDIEVNTNNNSKQSLQTIILKRYSELNYKIISEGVLDLINESFGFLRYSKNNYTYSLSDIYISQGQIKKFGLRVGDRVKCIADMPKKGEKYISLNKIISVNDLDYDKNSRAIKFRHNFDDLTPIYPEEIFKFDNDINTRCINLIAPMGKGQRALLVAPPRTGKTILMQKIAKSITLNHPEVSLMILLIGERPEEVTDMIDSVDGEVIASTFDEPANRHVQISEMAIAKAKRMVENKKDVVIVLDSITRLARAYNVIAPSSGKILTGGVDSNALQKPKAFFGAARNLREGGSLTIIATALNDMGGSKMDEFILEEFRGTGNMELYLDRKVADRRIYPAIDPIKSGTRKEELLLDKDTLPKHWILRRLFSQMNGSAEAMDFLLDKVRNSKTNDEFFENMNK